MKENLQKNCVDMVLLRIVRMQNAQMNAIGATVGNRASCASVSRALTVRQSILGNKLQTSRWLQINKITNKKKQNCTPREWPNMPNRLICARNSGHPSEIEHKLV